MSEHNGANEGLPVLLYGDRKREVNLHEFVDSCKAASPARPWDLDGLRSFVILTGQLEQAIEDSESQNPGNGFQSDSTLAKLARETTDASASAFCTCFNCQQDTEDRSIQKVEQGLDLARSLLRKLGSHPNRSLTVKVPEGFAFYGLYPEQHCLAAAKWAAASQGANSKRGLVIGLRSIGTTLSAVVAASLRGMGWETTRLTLRPDGDPFKRQVTNPPLDASPDLSALVVDEGPGLSGSSMAAVAEWLRCSGIQDIAFLPGHANDPGRAASDVVRRCWENIPRYCCSIEEVRWSGKTFKDLLAEDSMAHGIGRVRAVDDLSGGKWRKVVFEDESQRPAIFRTLERVKFLCRGTHSAVLWKFDGFIGGNEAWTGRIEKLSDEDLVLRVIGRRMGFVALPWIEGGRLQPQDAKEPEVLKHLGFYISQSAGPALAETEAIESIERLSEMLYCNVKEGIGEHIAEKSLNLKQAALDDGERSAYGDGHLAPYEWVRTENDRIIKTDCFGHTFDHTLIGKQSVLWDVAGLIIEWELSESQIAALFREFRRGGFRVCGDALRFYLCCYAAFRLGMMSFSHAEGAGDIGELKRIAISLEKYKRDLNKWLEAGLPGGLPRVNVPVSLQVRARSVDRESTITAQPGHTTRLRSAG